VSLWKGVKNLPIIGTVGTVRRIIFFGRLVLQRLQPNFPFLSLIIVEPVVSAEGGHDLAPLRTRLMQNAERRISEWPDREAVLLYLKTRPGMMAWDERVLKVFVVCGFHLFSMH